jgi:diguanylate cyclase (GGDEF)-like protein
MKPARIPDNEEARLHALRRLNLLDTEPELAFDDLTRLAADICDTPIALISLVDADRQWFKSRCGLQARETSRDVSMCAHAFDERDGVLMVPDTRLDDRFADNPLVLGEPYIRFYAGVVLWNVDGLPLGALCVIDHRPRTLDERQQRALKVLAQQSEAQLHLRLRLRELHETTGALQRQKSLLMQRHNTLEQRCEQLAVEARIDALTGVSCRRDANDRLADEFRVARQLAMPLSVCLIDIDRFKQVNDTYGHARGDDALRQVARLLASSLRSDDYLARFGGEEFVVMLPNTPAEVGRQIAERLRRSVEEGPWFAPAQLTVSIGLATSEPQCTSIGELIEAADTALYQAKNLGRNRVESAAPAAP